MEGSSGCKAVDMGENLENYNHRLLHYCGVITAYIVIL
jgi:hypothetical protein